MGGAVFPSVICPLPRTLLNILDDAVRRWPGALALDDGESALTYSDLDAEVGRLAASLRERGVGTGDRVGVRIPSGTADLYVAVLAVLSAGAAYVPVDADDPDERAEQPGLLDFARAKHATQLVPGAGRRGRLSC
jgi:non-ribosomal peptide synthetase component F